MIKEPITIKSKTASNRLVMPPMATYRSTADGMLTDDLCEYYGKCTDGGRFGIVITEHGYINISGRAGIGQFSLADESCIPGLEKLAGAIHENGSIAIAQMNHAGSLTTPDVTGCDIVSASAVPNIRKKPGVEYVLPRELTKEEIHGLEDDFAKAALIAKKAGFDGVQIHSAHCYLLCQFFSPLTNKRTDEYGPQSIENRTRFHVEAYRKVRKAVGDDFIVSLRLGGCDYMEGGSTIEDAVDACRIFEKEGIDLLDLSGGMCFFTREGHPEAGYFSDMSEAVRKAVSVPVITTGGVSSPGEAELLLKEGKADLIGIGRKMNRFFESYN